jgi:hypothetical protein
MKHLMYFKNAIMITTYLFLSGQRKATNLLASRCRKRPKHGKPASIHGPDRPFETGE